MTTSAANSLTFKSPKKMRTYPLSRVLFSLRELCLTQRRKLSAPRGIIANN
jgi:hypothetical protein